MKLIEKKCPSCGADLKFDHNDTEVVCEYCGGHFIIQKETNEVDTEDKAKQIVEEFALIEDVMSQINLNKMFKNVFPTPKIVKVIVAIFVVIWVLAFIMIISSFFSFDKVFNSFSESFNNGTMVVETKKDNYVTKIEEIDEKSLEIFHKETLKNLNKLREVFYQDVQKSEWTYVGMYLLTNKDEDASDFDKVNELYDVYKKTIVGDNINLEIYASVEYTNLKLTDDNIVSNSFRGYANAPMTFVNGGTSSYVHGYEGNEELYNKVIRSQSGKFNIIGTEGMYVES